MKRFVALVALIIVRDGVTGKRDGVTRSIKYDAINRLEQSAASAF